MGGDDGLKKCGSHDNLVSPRGRCFGVRGLASGLLKHVLSQLCICAQVRTTIAYQNLQGWKIIDVGVDLSDDHSGNGGEVP